MSDVSASDIDLRGGLGHNTLSQTDVYFSHYESRAGFQF